VPGPPDCRYEHHASRSRCMGKWSK